MVKIFFMLLPRAEDITWLVTFSKLLSSRSFINMRDKHGNTPLHLNLVKSISLKKTSPINLSKKIFLLTYGVTARAAFGGEN